MQYFEYRLQVAGACAANPNIAVALSGGADSMALVTLAHAWVAAHGGQLTALTLDHQLRPASMGEVQKVAGWMADRGIPHHILTLNWHGANTSSNLQARARQLRYQALGAWCAAHHVPYLLTAHHADDVAETLMMRLWRGSDIEGLAGIPDMRQTSWGTIFRPLIGVPKTALMEYLQQQHIAWLEDPSNQTDDYERNRVRRLLAEFPLPEGAATQFCSMMATTRGALVNESQALLDAAVVVHEDGTAMLDMAQFLMPERAQPISGVQHNIADKAQRMALSQLIMHVSGSEKPVRSEELSRLLAAWHASHRKPAKYTLGGLIFEQSAKKNRQHMCFICREPGRIARESAFSTTSHLTPHLLWDGRFEVRAADAALHPPAADFLTSCSLLPLGAKGLAILAAKRVKFPTHLTHSGRLGLLSIWHLDQLLAVPHIGYWNKEVLPMAPALNIRFAPAVPLCFAEQRYFN